MVSITDLEKVHATGFNLQEVKVTFNHDVKMNVAGINVEAREGEILNVPRWVADVLESDKHVEIQDTDMVVELKQAVVKENVQGEFELATLDPHFYIKLKAQMKKLSESDFDKVESMLNQLIRKRQGKIVRLADSSKLTAELSNKLTFEEREFYNNLHNISNSFTNQVLGKKQ